MCSVCGLTNIPVCTIAGGCSVQLLDYIKVGALTGGAGLGFTVALMNEKIKSLLSNEKRTKSTNTDA